MDPLVNLEQRVTALEGAVGSLTSGQPPTSGVASTATSVLSALNPFGSSPPGQGQANGQASSTGQGQPSGQSTTTGGRRRRSRRGGMPGFASEDGLVMSRRSKRSRRSRRSNRR